MLFEAIRFKVKEKMPIDPDFVEKVEARLQSAREKVEELRQSRASIEEELRHYESECQTWERVLALEGVEVAQGNEKVDLYISVPKAVEDVMFSNPGALSMREVGKEVQRRNPNLIVSDLGKQCGNALVDGVKKGKYTRLSRGLYTVKKG